MQEILLFNESGKFLKCCDSKFIVLYMVSLDKNCQILASGTKASRVLSAHCPAWSSSIWTVALSIRSGFI